MAYASEESVILLPKDLEQFGDTIRQDAFINRTDITSIIFPPCIKVIDESAFYGCRNVRTIVFPPALETIGKEAFQHCSSITALELPASLREIKDHAFTGTSLALSSVQRTPTHAAP